MRPREVPMHVPAATLLAGFCLACLSACSDGPGRSLAATGTEPPSLSQERVRSLVAGAQHGWRGGTTLARSEGIRHIRRALCEAGTLEFRDWKARVEDVLPVGTEAAGIVVRLAGEMEMRSSPDAPIPRTDPLFGGLVDLRPGTNLRMSGTLAAPPGGCPQVDEVNGDPSFPFRLTGFRIGR